MKHLLTYITIVLCLLGGCGGGSEGTGTAISTRTLEGQVTTTTGTPLSNADVTLLETGDATITDEQGHFLLSAPLSARNITLEVAKAELKGAVVLSDLDADATAIDVSLVVDEKQGEVTASNIQVWSRVIGDCDRYFENRPIIRQSVPLSRPLSCTMRFFVSGDGRRLERVGGEMQVRSCNSKRWRTIANGSTGVGVKAGYGDIHFTFIDDERNCEYRVAAPIGLGSKDPLFVYLHTLTLQSRAD